MCGIAGASCFHGSCRVVGNAERCECDAMYSGSQCFYRDQLLSFELPLAAGAIALTLVVGLIITRKVRTLLTFKNSPTDAFAFPREWKRGDAISHDLELLTEEENPSRRSKCSLEWLWRVVGVWGGEASKGVPWKPRRRVWENVLIALAFLLEIVPWIQSTAVAFLPVVPWPVAAKSSASILRMSLLYPLWSHLKPSKFPRLEFYAALAFVPGVFVASCAVGAKRFPLFKPQPKDSPAEDLCTLILRLYSHWVALPAMIMLLLPLECFFISYASKEGGNATASLPHIDSECFAMVPMAHAVAGVVALVLFWSVSCAVAFQLNCESSHPTPMLWTDIRYLRIDVLLRAPLAIIWSAHLAIQRRRGLIVVSCGCDGVGGGRVH